MDHDDAMDGLPEDLPEDIRRELAEARSDERCDEAAGPDGEDDDLPEELLAELRETFARCDAEEEPHEEQPSTHSLVNTSLVSAASPPPTKEGSASLSPEELKARLPAALEVTVVRKQASPPPPPPQSRSQQHKFLESLLASPKKSDLDSEETEQREPLDLGPPPTKRTASPVTPPASKKPKLDDITLRHLLSRQPENAVDAKPEEDSKRAGKARRSSEPPAGSAAAAAAAAHKSRLLELLMKEGNVDADPLAQLKQVLSDPDLMVPDPLLVPRSRLQALVTSPAQEIPRLLAQNAETRVPYPGDTLVVPLSHLTSLLQPAAGAPPSAYQPANVGLMAGGGCVLAGSSDGGSLWVAPGLVAFRFLLLLLMLLLLECRSCS